MAGSFFVAPDRAAVGKNNLKGKDQEKAVQIRDFENKLI